MFCPGGSASKGHTSELRGGCCTKKATLRSFSSRMAAMVSSSLRCRGNGTQISEDSSTMREIGPCTRGSTPPRCSLGSVHLSVAPHAAPLPPTPASIGTSSKHYAVVCTFEDLSRYRRPTRWTVLVQKKSSSGSALFVGGVRGGVAEAGRGQVACSAV